MPISMYSITVPCFIRMLGNLSAFLKKGEEYAKGTGIDEAEFLGKSLAPEMFNLTRQVQTVSDVAKGCAARLAGKEIPSYEDNEKTFVELYARIDKTVEYLESFTPEHIDGTEENNINIKLPDRELNLPGQSFVLNFATPNFYFHTTMAYAILRNAGVDVGKMDYIGGPSK